MKSLYIHIPFCDHICFYCDFPKRVATLEYKEKYMKYLSKELEMYDPKNLKTIYIGGGTPSSIPIPLLEELLSKLPKVEESTFECNPNDINKNLLETLKRGNITRISLGVQTFNDSLLKDIGRTHSKDESIQAIELIKSYDFDLSIDLIFNLPNQTEEDLLYDLELSELSDHISYYSLILEENTVFEKMINKGKLTEPTKDSEFFEIVIEYLTSKDYEHYEISNFTRNKKSLHNLTYWNNEEYYGVGLAASGYINGTRYYNNHLFKNYYASLDADELPIEHQDELSKNDIMFEHLMLGFRKIEGFSISEFEQKYDISLFKAFSELENLVSEGYLLVENDTIRVSKKGLYYNNDLLIRLL